MSVIWVFTRWATLVDRSYPGNFPVVRGFSCRQGHVENLAQSICFYGHTFPKKKARYIVHTKSLRWLEFWHVFDKILSIYRRKTKNAFTSKSLITYKRVNLFGNVFTRLLPYTAKVLTHRVSNDAEFCDRHIINFQRWSICDLRSLKFFIFWVLIILWLHHETFEWLCYLETFCGYRRGPAFGIRPLKGISPPLHNHSLVIGSSSFRAF